MPNFKRFTDLADHREVSRWGVAALICGATAIFCANVAAFLAPQTLNSLHATRLQGASLNQMRGQLVALADENARIASEYRALQSRFNLMDDNSGATIRRLAAVENSLPLLIESLPIDSDIDRSLLTASIAEAGGEVYEVEGGTIRIKHSPLFDDIAQDVPDQPMPPALATEAPRAGSGPGAPDLAMQGIAVGQLIAPPEADAAYAAILERAGVLLLGTAPLLARNEQGEAQIVIGPLPSPTSAQALCVRLARLDLACSPTLYEGEDWPG